MFDDINELENEIKKFKKNVVASEELISSITDLAQVVGEQNEQITSGFQQSRVQVEDLFSSGVNEMKASNESSIESGITRLEALREDIQKSNSEYVSELNSINDELQKSIQDVKSEVGKAVTGNEEKITNSLTQNVDKLVGDVQKSNREYIDELNGLNSELNRIIEESKNKLAAAFINNENKIDSSMAQTSEMIANELKRQITDSTIKFNEIYSKIESSNVSYVSRLEEYSKEVTDATNLLNIKYKEFVEILERTNFDKIYSETQNINREVRTLENNIELLSKNNSRSNIIMITGFIVIVILQIILHFI